MPESVQTIILSWVDRLPPDLKQVLRSASVIGRLFQVQLLAQIIPPPLDLEQSLWKLEERALIYRERVVPEVEYSFKHVLIQEAVYQTIPRRQQQELHRQAAEALEQLLHADCPDQYYEQLAYHYYHSPAHAKAIEYLLKAGEKSGRAYLNEEAIHYFKKALQRLEQLSPDASTPDKKQLDWRLAALTSLGQIYHGLGQNVEAEQYLRQAIEVGESAHAPAQALVRLYYWLSEVVHWQQRYGEEIELGERGVALLKGEDAESVEAALMNQAMAVGHFAHGNWDMFYRLTDSTAHFIQDLPYSQELRSPYIHIIMALHDRKREAEGDRWLHTLETLAEQHHDLRALAEAVHHRWGYRLYQGDLGRITEFPRVLELFENIGDHNLACRCLKDAAFNYLILGDLEQAEICTGQALDMAQTFGFEASIAEAHLIRGFIFLYRQAWPQAAAALQQVLEIRSGDDSPWLNCAANYSLGRVYLAQGERRAALDQFQKAAAMFNPHLPPLWRLRWWPLWCGILNGLETTFETSQEFQAFCRRFEGLKSETTMPPMPQQWYLEAAPGETGNLTAPSLYFEGSFIESLEPDWRWQDPLADCSWLVHHGLEIRAANGRDLWLLNRSSPRLLRSISGDFVAQTSCRPTSPPSQIEAEPDPAQKPAIGGLLLWKDAHNFLRLTRGGRGKWDIALDGCLNSEDIMLGCGLLPGPNSPQALPDEWVFLRLQRTGAQVQGLCSSDGQHWFSLGQVTFPISDPVELGLHAAGWIDRMIYPGIHPEGSAIRFESFQIYRPVQ